MTALRLAKPLLTDFSYLASRMRPDEIAHYCALRGSDVYDPECAARAMAATDGPAWTLVAPDGTPVMTGGFSPVRGGVYAAWAVGTMGGWAEHWRAITRACRRLIRALLADGAHRIQITTLATRHATHAWYEAIGLKREALRVGYFANGADGMSFACTRSTP